MPPIQTPTDPGSPTPDEQHTTGLNSGNDSTGVPPPPRPIQTQAPDVAAPLSFVPHDPAPTLGDARIPGFRIRTNRYGDLEEHELVHLLDSIEDERARARFRESIYISVFFWIVVAWVVLYGPRYLWHAPVLINPVDAIKQHELTQLNMPILRQPVVKAPTPAPKPLDNKTLNRLREMTRETPSPAPAPQPAKPMPSTTTPPMALPSAPTPTLRPTPPVIAEAPTPQPSARFPPTSGSASDNIQNAVRNAGRGHGNSTQFSASPSNPLGGGVDILSDTQGVDFDPYLRRIIADIKRNWLPLIPEEARPPLSKQGETYIRFTINPDGNIAVMHLDGSTHDVAIDHSCWSAIVSEGQFPPLPSQFHGPNLELRIHFLVNKGLEQ